MSLFSVLFFCTADLEGASTIVVVIKGFALELEAHGVTQLETCEQMHVYVCMKLMNVYY